MPGMSRAGGRHARAVRSSRAGRGAAVLLVAVVVVQWVGQGTAAAHTELESSTPTTGSTGAAPSAIELRFTEAVEVPLSHVWLRDLAGYLELTPVAAVDGSGRVLSVPVPPIGDGTYDVVFHVVARDGTPVSGDLTFSVAGTPAPAVVAPPVTSSDPAADPPPDPSLAVILPAGLRTAVLPELPEHGHGPGGLTTSLAHGILDASLATLVGGLAFVSAVWPQAARLQRTRQLLRVAAVVGVVASFELAAFQHAGATGLGTAEAFTPWHQWDALQYRFGQVAAARIVLLIGAAALTALLARDGARTARSVTWCTAACVVALGLAETLVLLSHTSDPGVIDTVARVLHVLGVSTWIGGLVMLLVVVLPRRRVDELVAVLPRFSQLATVAVGVLTAGGLLLAVDGVGAADALPSTGYGRMLLAKTAVVGGVLLVAARGRARVAALVTARPRPDGASAARPVALLVGTEVGLMAVVLGLTMALVTWGPPA